jgi:hypothetical protein
MMAKKEENERYFSSLREQGMRIVRVVVPEWGADQIKKLAESLREIEKERVANGNS